MSDKMREEFEAWAQEDPPLGWPITRDKDGYVYDPVDIAWLAWQASRDLLVVELPETELTGAIGMAHKSVTKRCRAAIEAAGVRVKP